MVTFEGRNHTSHTVTQGQSMLGTSENVKWTDTSRSFGGTKKMECEWRETGEVTAKRPGHLYPCKP